MIPGSDFLFLIYGNVPIAYNYNQIFLFVNRQIQKKQKKYSDGIKKQTTGSPQLEIGGG